MEESVLAFGRERKRREEAVVVYVLAKASSPAIDGDFQRHVGDCLFFHSQREGEREREEEEEQRDEFGDNGTDQSLCFKRNRGALCVSYVPFGKIYSSTIK